MHINQVTGSTMTNRFVRNNRKTQQSQTVPSTVNQPAGDNVAFRGGITHGINSSRQWQYYGDIFKPGANLVNKKLIKAKADLVKLMNANLSYAKMMKSTFHCANFTGANLTGTNFENSTLDGSWFKDVITNDTNLKMTYLNGAIFKGDFGPKTSLEKANVRSADFVEANLDNVNLKGALYDNFTEFPNGFDPKSKGLILYKDSGMDFSHSSQWERMKLRYSIFYDANFQRAGLKRADMKGCTFENCDMRNCDMTRVYAKKANIVNSDLTRSELKQLNLDKAFLKNVDMKNCNLRGAVLTWETAQNVNLNGAIYDQYTVFNSGFNPNEHGMSYVYSSPAYYGIK